MYISKHEPRLTVPATEGTVLTIQGLAAQRHRVVHENLDGANTLTWRWQSSNDASSWVDVAADTTLAPGLRVQSELIGSIFYRLRASGNLAIAAKVDSELGIISNTFSMAVS